MEFNSLNITILLIISAVIVGFIARRRSKDRCLRDFNKSPITVEKINGNIIAKGILDVKTTGLVINFPEMIMTPQGFPISSTLIYKYEFDLIQAIIRPHEELSQHGKNKRERKLKKTHRPTLLRKAVRKIRNIFNALKDSFLEIMNISITYLTARKASILMPHDKYVRNINSELLESVGMSHEPLLEPYIGHMIVFEMIKSDKKIKLSGILKDYTKEFIEVMDVNYILPNETEPELVDMIIPQKLAIVRHFSEKIPYRFAFLKEITSFSSKISKIESDKEKETKKDTN
ncbi:MAG: hypothetical protein JXL97_07905 [Bacteroidales bacterium]|nr:hypothetical protein [Bacteroidales bacterium]